jgi:hypothetical protein
MNQVSGIHAPKSLSSSINDLIAEGGHALASDDKRAGEERNWKADIAALAPIVRARLMAKYAVTHNGRHYEACGHRYDLLADAVVYTKLRRSLNKNEIAPTQCPENVEVPTASQRRLMAQLSIAYRDGIYQFGEYRYDRLDDAVNYAELKKHSLNLGISAP